jgi:alanine-synthesizing transaminase
MKKFNIHSDQQMTLDLLRRQRILVTAGTGFNWPEQDHFRIVFLPNLITLQDAANKLERFFDGYRQK